MENEEVKKNSKKGLVLAIILFLIIALSFCYYFMFIRGLSPNFVFENAINKIYFETKDIYKDLALIKQDKSLLEYNVKFSSNGLNSSKILNNLNIKGSYFYNLEEKQIALNSKILYKNGEALNLNMELNENGFFAGLFNNLMYSSKEEINKVWNAFDYEEYEKILDKLEYIAKKNLKKEYYSKSKEKGAHKYSLTINKEEMKSYVAAILSDIQNDSEVLESIAKISSTDKEEINLYINDYKKKIQYTSYGDFKADIVLKGLNNIQSLSVKRGNQIINLNQKDKNIYDVTINEGTNKDIVGSLTIEGKTYLLKLKSSNDILSLTLNHSSSVFGLNISFKSGINEIMSIDYSKKDNNGKMNIKFAESALNNIYIIIDFNVNNVHTNNNTIEHYNNAEINNEYLKRKMKENQYLNDLITDLGELPAFKYLFMGLTSNSDLQNELIY